MDARAFYIDAKVFRRNVKEFYVDVGESNTFVSVRKCSTWTGKHLTWTREHSHERRRIMRMREHSTSTQRHFTSTWGRFMGMWDSGFGASDYCTQTDRQMYFIDPQGKFWECKDILRERESDFISPWPICTSDMVHQFFFGTKIGTSFDRDDARSTSVPEKRSTGHKLLKWGFFVGDFSRRFSGRNDLGRRSLGETCWLESDADVGARFSGKSHWRAAQELDLQVLKCPSGLLLGE